MKKTYKLINVPRDPSGDFGIERIKGSISNDGLLAFGVCREILDQYFKLDSKAEGTQYYVEITNKRTRYGYTIERRFNDELYVDGEYVMFFNAASRVLRTILKPGRTYYVSMWKS